jgi:hypothetical protein
MGSALPMHLTSGVCGKMEFSSDIAFATVAPE